MTQTMTREQVLALKPGNNLDLIVAIEVMGHEPGEFRNDWIKLGPKFEGCPKRYSSDMSKAWEVVDHMAADEWDVTIELRGFKHDKKSYECYFGCMDSVKTTKAPEAICKAALLAVLDL